jgi:hypothetical protein
MRSPARRACAASVRARGERRRRVPPSNETHGDVADDQVNGMDCNGRTGDEPGGNRVAATRTQGDSVRRPSPGGGLDDDALLVDRDPCALAGDSEDLPAS